MKAKESKFYNGTVDDVYVYNRSLNDSELLDAYNRGLSYLETNVSSNNLEAHYKFNADFTDSQGNYDMVNVGGVPAITTNASWWSGTAFPLITYLISNAAGFEIIYYNGTGYSNFYTNTLQKFFQIIGFDTNVKTDTSGILRNIWYETETATLHNTSTGIWTGEVTYIIDINKSQLVSVFTFVSNPII